MAVQQNKKSKSRKNMRRSHDRVRVPNVVLCKCGEPTLPHAICPSCGTYRGRRLTAGDSGEES
ncbi:MAG: 50S ribosomal protein L32 [Deltaproteobacteria bacterium]|jgi:large subunit ribosomal protein L32|nr:50S ribosomal protein L32 [Deltaproteobacteria bacterium]